MVICGKDPAGIIAVVGIATGMAVVGIIVVAGSAVVSIGACPCSCVPAGIIIGICTKYICWNWLCCWFCCSCPC